MAYLGKGVKQKFINKIEDSLDGWLEKDELVVAVFKATRMKPPTDSIIITNRRVFCAVAITRQSSRGFFSETLASEIKGVRADLPKSRLMRTTYPAKLIIEHPDGTEDFLASIRESDAPAALRAIQRVSGSSKHLRIREQVDKEYRQKKAQDRERKAEEKAANKRELEAIRIEERAYETTNPTSSQNSLNSLEKVAHSSKNASKRLNKISNRLLIVVVLLVVGLLFFPIGIIAWVFAVFAFLSIFND